MIFLAQDETILSTVRDVLHRYLINEGMESFVSCFRKIGAVKTMEGLLEKPDITYRRHQLCQKELTLKKSSHC